MIAVNYTTMRNNLKDVLDKVTDDSEPVIINRKDEKSVVLISLDLYNNLIENDFIFSNEKYYNRLLHSKKQIEEGKTVSKTLEDLEVLING